MDKEPLKTIWLGVMLGMLVVTAPQWLNASHHQSSYSAPWIYPSDQPDSCK